jgi:hypothetical protein
LPPEPAPVAVQPWGAILAAIVAGAFLGTALTYLLSTFAPLPTNAPVIADPSADLAAHEQRLNALESSNAALADEAKRTETSLGATIAQLDAGLADLRKSIADAQAATAPADDLAAIRTQLATLSDRLDAVAAGASSPDAEALARTIAGLQAAVTAVQTQVADLQAGGGATQTTLDALEGNVDELQQALAVREAEPEPAAPTGARVEAADALDAALADGAPFAAPLRAAAVASPGLAILPALAAAADGGLPTAETLANRFALRVPDMLAARHPAAGEDWQQSALDWMKSMLAVRPSEEMAGDAPEAVVSRLEAAMARHDFRTAASLFAQLPAEMRLPAADIEQQVGLRIAAEDLIAALRAPAAAGGVQ